MPWKRAFASLSILSMCMVASAADPSITVADPQIRFDANLTTWKGDLLIKAENLSANQAGSTPLLTDLNDRTPPAKIVFGAPRLVKSSDKARYWLVDTSVAGMTVTGPLSHWILLELDDLKNVVQCVLDNRGVAKFEWSFQAPLQRLALLRDRRVDVSLKTADRAATGIAIARSDLQDQSTNGLLSREFLQLCDDAGTCESEWSIAANTIKTLRLQVAPSFQRPGTYTGNVYLSVREKPEFVPMSLTVYSTSWCWRAFGIALLGVGLAIYWVITIWLRRWSDRLQRMLPAARLGDELRSLRGVIESIERKTGVKLHTTAGEIDSLLRDLSEQTLETAGLIPRQLANPFTSSVSINDLQDYLKEKAGRIHALAFLLRDGASALMVYWAGHATLVRSALADLDGKAPTIQALGEAQTAVKDVLTDLKTQIESHATKAFFDAPTHVDVPEPPPVREIEFSLNTSGWIFWIVWALLTLAVGVVALVLSNDGFGTWQDLTKCLFWGLGVTAAGQQLQQLAPSSVTQSLKLQVPGL